MSQTPFGFWYDLDILHFVEKINEKCRSQTPFGFWYVLDISAAPELLATLAEGHKRLSAFGMSWTLEINEEDKAEFRNVSQTPFGFWYVLDCAIKEEN